MGKVSLYIILTGVLLVLSSCMPVVEAVYRMATAESSVRFAFSQDGSLEGTMDVAQTSDIRLLLSFEFAVDGTAAYGARYSFEASNRSDSLGRWSGVIGHNIPSPDYSSIPGDGGVVIEKWFPVIELTAGQQALSVRGRIEQTHADTPTLTAAYAEIYRDPPQIRTSFVGAVGLWTAGILLTLIGAIQWIRGISIVPAQAGNEEQGGGATGWRTACHLSALLGYVFPFGHIIGPAMIWVAKRDTIPGLDAAGRESLNFQLTVTLFALIGVMLSIVFVGLVLLFAVIVLHFSMTVYASMQAQRGRGVRYPLNLRIIKAR